MSKLRADKKGPHRVAFEKNKRRLLKTTALCGICGKPVDKSLRYPHPLSPAIDHIIPVSKGGHPSAMENLQLTHWQCNRQKSDKLYSDVKQQVPRTIGNRNLPQSRDWSSYAVKK
ncbi:TPA: HNH endonuclease [Streptococcus agalactiae]|uniref:HNH endonuclease signature motif containing protein n=1 Tax=Streptococcus agalactiae TaxID=1311 RepID=UPI0002F8E522|nr:HNH endonuclease signature motif containing protein [Streptococcus agalactiae]EPV88244.1 HNH endonuclease [Streptococcus agalactiae FSL S3-251]EPV89950.1 HNH endonuclease [Streptococcus agalactiae FSL S3-105]MCQ3822901.1 HNH endonuclease [Streptococcus agalactiae]MCQ3825259.1 HNH endonuclease [Streptococcus agalactiae]MCQ3827686.1 HNH endonuclease [Streptococcus agalactiae]